MTTLQDIAPSKLKPHPRNLRTDVGDVTELAASIREKGIIEPLIVAPNLGTTYTLLAGHRRLAAAKEAKCKTVPCLVRDDLTDPAAQLETMLVENLQRTDLTPLWQRCEWHCRCNDTYIGSYADCDGFRLIECRGTTDIIDRRRTGTDVYTHLRALERQGLATRQRIDGHPRVYWTATHIGAAVDELAQLEAMWTA